MWLYAFILEAALKLVMHQPAGLKVSLPQERWERLAGWEVEAASMSGPAQTPRDHRYHEEFPLLDLNTQPWTNPLPSLHALPPPLPTQVLHQLPVEVAMADEIADRAAKQAAELAGLRYQIGSAAGRLTPGGGAAGGGGGGVGAWGATSGGVGTRAPDRLPGMEMSIVDRAENNRSGGRAGSRGAAAGVGGLPSSRPTSKGGSAAGTFDPGASDSDNASDVDERVAVAVAASSGPQPLALAWKRLLLRLCLFHATLLDRGLYTSLGWRRAYDFSAADFLSAVKQVGIIGGHGVGRRWVGGSVAAAAG